MPSPPPVRQWALPGAILGALLLTVAPVAAQQPDTGTQFSPFLDAVLGGLGTLIIGGGLVAFAPEYTERTTDRILDQPGETFIYGFGIFLAFILVVILLAITVVGIVLLIPLVIAAAVVAELGYLAAGRTVSDEWSVVLVTAIVVGAFTSGIPVLGGLVGFVLGCMGVGAWYLDYRDDGSGAGSGTDLGPSLPGGSRGSTSGGDVTDEWGTSGSTLGGAGATHQFDVDTARSEPDADADGDAKGDKDADGDADGDGKGAADTDDSGDEWTVGFDDEDRE